MHSTGGFISLVGGRPASFSQVGLAVEDLAVVPVNVLLQVGHTPVAHFHCILIDNLV